MFIVYHKETTERLYGKSSFRSEAAAKAAITRETKRNTLLKKDDFAYIDSHEFHKIEKTETKINLMTGKPFTQPVNTPRICDPSTETYWSA